MKMPLPRLLLTGLFLVLPATGLQAAKTFREKLGESLTVVEYSLDTVMKKPETAIPAQFIQDAKGIIVVHQYRVGLIVGGQAGSAVMMVRNPNTKQWGPPVFLDPGGVNLGLQAGAKEINTVFILRTDDAVRRAYSGRFEIGADATAVAGPRNAEVENFDLFKADVWVYTSFGGLYAGASIKTGWLNPYHKANRELYNTTFATPEIALSTWFDVPAEAKPFQDKVKFFENGGTIQ